MELQEGQQWRRREEEKATWREKEGYWKFLKKIVRGEVLKCCIMEIMKSERGKEVKSNMERWKALAARAVSEEGSSRKNIAEFVNSLFNLQQGIAN